MSIDDELAAHVKALQAMVAASRDEIARVAAAISRCFERGGKVLICGNGGSAADAQHFAAEFMNRMHIDREPWPAIALTTDSSVMTSIANDSSYDAIFARQVEALGGPGDVLIALSTSGESESVLAAVKAGRRHGMVTVGFTGEAGADRMGPDCDLLLVVPSRQTARIQEGHEFAYHVIAGLVEQQLVSRELQDDTTTLRGR